MIKAAMDNEEIAHVGVLLAKRHVGPSNSKLGL